ncbi:MAG: DUF6807 family protein [bacterium]
MTGVRRALIVVALLAVMMPVSARAEWMRDSVSIAWMSKGAMVWRFSFDPKNGKPFFHPLAVGDGPSFTNFKPEDHPWHYGLWFSWKYINHVNYWEEDRTSGQAAGSTRWSTPVIDARTDGSAKITMSLSYIRASGDTDLTEMRVIDVSAPTSDGSYTIDWDMRFKAGKDGAVLDRTPMPGEPNGVVNGGYAGFSVRLAALPLRMAVVTSDSSVTDYVSDRARPFASAVAGNFSDAEKDVGGIAILSDTANMRGKSPWYVINTRKDFQFICAAVLAPAVRALAAGEEWRLRYRVALQRSAWTTAALNDAMKSW